MGESHAPIINFPEHIHVHFHGDQKLNTIVCKLDHLIAQGSKLMAILDELTDQVTANNDTISSAIQLIQNIHTLLVAAGTDPVKLQALKDSLAAKDTELAQAIVDNTPAAP